MKISLLKETKKFERRVALIPNNVRKLVQLGHQVFVQKQAGVGAGFSDRDYSLAGATMVTQVSQLISRADLLVKVKEPSFAEIRLMKPGQMIFCYLHLAAFPKILRGLLQKRICALGYETVELSNGSLPLLTPMSEIAGKMGTQNGAHFLRADQGGRGVLMGGTEKIEPARVVVLGGGVVGENAARIAMGMGARTSLLDISKKRLRFLQKKYGKGLQTCLSNPRNIGSLVCRADLVIGAVLVPGAKAPKLISKNLVKKMKKGSVIVDVAVDQGGCVETSEVTTHRNPIKIKYGVLHYSVANIPAVVPVTGTLALTKATFPYIKRLAQLGLEKCCEKFPEMARSINCKDGQIVHPGLLGS